jgi:hypothetical protein
MSDQSSLDFATLQAMARATRLKLEDVSNRYTYEKSYAIFDGDDSVFESNDLDHVRAFMLGWIGRGNR